MAKMIYQSVAGAFDRRSFEDIAGDAQTLDAALFYELAGKFLGPSLIEVENGDVQASGCQTVSQGMADDASPARYSHRFANQIFKSHGTYVHRIGFYRLFPPDIGFPEPSRGDRLFPGVKANAIASLDMKVPEKRIVPAAEREHGHGCWHAYIDANHAGLNAMFEFASGTPRCREDRGSVAEC